MRSLSNKYNALLIFDECTTGFRETFGGLHKKYNVFRDIVIFGKALGNGYAITAVLGKKKTLCEKPQNLLFQVPFGQKDQDPQRL